MLYVMSVVRTIIVLLLMMRSFDSKDQTPAFRQLALLQLSAAGQASIQNVVLAAMRVRGGMHCRELKLLREHGTTSISRAHPSNDTLGDLTTWGHIDLTSDEVAFPADDLHPTRGDTWR